MKKWNLINLLCLTILILGATVCQSIGDEDHLHPVDLNRNSKYRRLVNSKVCITRFDCGRAFTLPSFKPESCVAVYSERSKGGSNAYFVTYTKATDSLWQRTDGGNRPQGAQGLKTQRIDADLPPPVAEVVRHAWQNMLTRVRPERRPSASEWRMISIDGTEVEFSVRGSKGSPLYGKLNASLPPPGNNTKQLLRLTDALVAYCQFPDKRSHIAKKIEGEAKQLLVSLQTERQREKKD